MAACWSSCCLFLVGLSLVQSSLITNTCDNKGELKFADVSFEDSSFHLDSETCGQNVNLNQVNFGEPPTTTFPDADLEKYYLIAMVDPDAPYRDNPTARSWLHWIVGNIKGSDLKTGDISDSGTTVKDYNPPTPPAPKPGKTNIHRYFIFVFEQEGMLDTSDLEVDGRANFDIDDYSSADRNNLKAVAMNMFETQHQ